MKKLLVLLTIVCISLTSCDVLSDLLDDPDTSEFFTLAENTKIYSEDEMEYFVKDSDRTLTISAEAPSETVPVVGDIIICPISESTPPPQPASPRKQQAAFPASPKRIRCSRLCKNRRTRCTTRPFSCKFQFGGESPLTMA